MARTAASTAGQLSAVQWIAPTGHHPDGVNRITCRPRSKTAPPMRFQDMNSRRLADDVSPAPVSVALPLAEPARIASEPPSAARRSTTIVVIPSSSYNTMPVTRT